MPYISNSGTEVSRESLLERLNYRQDPERRRKINLKIKICDDEDVHASKKELAELYEANGRPIRAGDLYQDIGDYNKAGEMYEQAGEDHFYLAGAMYEKGGDYDKAGEMYKKAGDDGKAQEMEDSALFHTSYPSPPSSP